MDYLKSRIGKEGFYRMTIAILVLSLFILGFILVRKSPPISQTSPAPLASPIQAYDADQEKYTWEVKEIAQGLDTPWDLALDSDGKIYITERGGKVKVLGTDGILTQVADFPQVAEIGESGMTGLALNPNFSENGFVYIYYTYRNSGNILNRVSRFTFDGLGLSDEKIILDNIPGGTIHNGGRMKFGPDKKLWITTGDASRGVLAQDPKSLAGKILRVNEDGSTPLDNPFPGSLVYSIGHRNPQGIDFHPLSEEIVVTSHGETAYDEVNIIKALSNHGWPEVKKCFSDRKDFVEPILCSMEQTWAPSGAAFMGTKIWRFRYSYVFAGLRGELLERIDIIDTKVVDRETIIKGTYGRLRAVMADKEGNLYVTTSNRDGRGKVRQGDDKILKITPQLVK